MRPSDRRAERGATLVHMAIAMVALMAFSALVIDYGIFWVSRRQAQNSADAGALAGAMALAFDDPLDQSASGPAQLSAKAAAEANPVWGQQPSVLTNTDITFPACPDFPSDTCVKVDVYRTSRSPGGVARNNSLPTFFGRLVGVNTQDVEATATARILSGTQTNCLRPWAVADKWEERVRCTNFTGGGSCNGSWVANTTWDLLQTYDKYDRQGALAGVPAPGPDYYRAPGTTGPNDPGTGFRLENLDGSPADYGQFMQLKLGGGENTVSPGWFLSLDMTQVWSSDPDGTPTPTPRDLCTDENCPNSSGAQLYEFAIENCVGGTAGIGDWLRVETGAMTGPTGQGTYTDAESLFNKDPGASWNGTEIIGSCAPGVCADGRYHETSPRIVPVALFDLDSYFSRGYTGSNGYVKIVNIFGFFVLSRAQGESMAAAYPLDTNGNASGKVYGIMMSAPSLTGGTNTIPPTSSFLQTIVLVR